MDVAGGRLAAERATAKKSSKNKHFNSVVYHPAGELVLAAGNSRFLCLYDVRNKVLLKRFEVTRNRSLDGVLDKLNSKGLALAEHADESASEEEEKEQLASAKRKNVLGERAARLAVRNRSLAFSPDGRAFACASTEGLLVYST